MSKKQSKKFYIQLNEKIFFDPNFSKDYQQFIPLKVSFFQSKEFERCSAAASKLLILYINTAHTLRSLYIDTDSTLYKLWGKSTESLLNELQENQLLTYSLNKEIKKEMNKINSEKDEVDFFKESIVQKNSKEYLEKFAKHFQEFILNKMGSSDLGLVINLWKKAHQAFLTIEAFDEFCNQVTNSETFKKIEYGQQMAYFKKALKDEIESRGVK